MISRTIADWAFSGNLLRNLQRKPFEMFLAAVDKLAGLYWKAVKKVDLQLSYLFIRRLTPRVPVQRNKVFFMSTRGDYQCNPKWICEELVREGVDCEIVWCIRAKTDVGMCRFPKKLKLVKRGSPEFYRELASSRVIVDNSINVIYLGYRPKPDQVYIETWHGAIGIKRFSAESVSEAKWKRDAYTSARYIAYLVSNSTLENEIYRECYWKENPILLHGHARNDILCEGDTPRVREIRSRVRQFFGLSPETKICLYAPTFREDAGGKVSNDVTPYGIDRVRLMAALEKRFGGTWKIMTRLHFKVAKLLKSTSSAAGCIDANNYPDIQELLTVVDVGITDYSSWICEYLLTRRPGFLFATDLDVYQKDQRGLYYPLESMPYPVARNNDELVDAVLNFKSEGFAESCDAFLRDKGCIDDGHAAERTVAKIRELISEGRKEQP